MDQSASETADALCQRMIQHSKQAHHRGNALLLGKVAALFTDRRAYGEALGCFYPVFEALESSLNEAFKRDKRVATMREVVVPLYRCAAYEQDLRFYLGSVGPNDDGDDGWRRLLPANTATQAYVVHLRHLAATQPLLLLAHAFTQHLAGLSGGVVLRRMARKHMALPQDQGTAIFEYPGGPEMKVAFKQRLDALGRGLSEQEVQQLLEEHVAAFRHNIGIIRAYRGVGLLAQLRAPLRLVPTRYWAALLAALVAGVAAAALAFSNRGTET